MGHILAVVFPLFAIMALGKLAVHLGYLDAAGAAVLSRFAFYLPTPALLFGLIAEGPPGDPFGAGGIYFLGCLLVYGFSLGAGRWLKNPSWDHRAAFALDTTFGNIVFLGTPLVFSIYGASGMSVLVGMIVLTNLLLPLSSILMEIGGTGSANPSRFGQLAIDMLKNPAINSVIAGFLWRATGWPLPQPVHLFVDLFARSAAPLALFCVGATLPAVTWGVITEALSASAVKLVVTPAVVGALCVSTGFTSEAMSVPVLAAAMPTGAGAFLLAQSTTAHSAAASATTVVTATAISLVTLPFLLYWLGPIRP